MDQARQIIRNALTTAQSPAVMCSFGKDSMLLLTLVREIRQDVPVLWFRDGTSEKFARRIIREWNLTAFSPAPADVYLVGPHTMIHEYDLDGPCVPMVIDLAQGEECALQKFPQRTTNLFLPFDVLLTGYKDTDTHWLKGRAKLWEDGAMAGRTLIIAPIRHMSDDQVRAALAEMNIPYRVGDDELPLCTACMTAGPGEVYCPEVGHFIPVHQWEQDKSLSAFRQRFQLED